MMMEEEERRAALPAMPALRTEASVGGRAFAHAALQREAKRYNSSNGEVLLVSVRTGEKLAHSVIGNPPEATASGSMMKPQVIAAAFQAGVVAAGNAVQLLHRIFSLGRAGTPPAEPSGGKNGQFLREKSCGSGVEGMGRTLRRTGRTQSGTAGPAAMKRRGMLLRVTRVFAVVGVWSVTGIPPAGGAESSSGQFREKEDAPVAAVRAQNLHEAANSGDRISVLRAKRDFAELHRAAASGDRTADLTLGRFFLLDQDQWGTGLRFLSRAARHGDPEALRLIGGEPGGSEVTEAWARLSGKTFAAALMRSLAGMGFTGRDVSGDFKLLRQNLAGTGLTLREETICDFADWGGHVFHAIAVRKGTDGKEEYYLLQSENASIQIDYLETVDCILHTWMDAGYMMIAYRTAAGAVFSGGWPVGRYQGMYPGNDGREEIVYRDFERGDLKSSHLPALRAFLPALKRLLRENRRKEIAALVRYPLILEENTLLEETIRNPEEFLRNFDRIFTGEWIRKILATPEDELFPGWEGAGVGTGLLWIVPGGDRAGKTVRIGRFGSRLF